jgi:predicted TIM-barrel fold metal-dependent hydrolase
MNRRAFLGKTIGGLGGLAGLPLLGNGIDILAQSGASGPSDPPHMRSPTQQMAEYRRIKEYLDSVPSIDMHEHLRAFDQLPGYVDTDHGRGMNLYGLWYGSYMQRIATLTPWESGQPFQKWWAAARGDFDNIRAADFYRYMWLAFRDLYGVDFDTITDPQAADLDRRIFENYRNPTWLYHVLQEKANIKLFVADRFWGRFNFKADYPFEMLTLNVTTLVWGFHPSEFDKKLHAFQISGPLDDPYVYARERSLPLNSLDDYLALLEAMFIEAKKGDAVCLKTTQAYERSLNFDNVSKERAEKAFGRPRSELSLEQIKDFEDFIMWRLAELSAKYEIPFQIHTGDARIQGSNPMLLVDFIQANPHTKFELFHGGFPWVGEIGAIGMKFPSHVWLNLVWLPTISYSTAKRALHEWLEVMPSNRITWGGDDTSAEGIYGETEMTRRCLAEVLAEKVGRGDLNEAEARHIGKGILRDNALDLYPRLKERS